MFLMWVENEFQEAGPATVNEPSAKCVLVRRTVKSYVKFSYLKKVKKLKSYYFCSAPEC